MRSADNKILVVGLRTGRLGNRLVLFANVIGFAAEHGYRVVNVAFHSYAHLFENTRRDIYCRYPVARRRSLFDLIPGAAPAIRKTRIFYQFIRRASEWNDRFPILGKYVFTLREVSTQTISLDSPEMQSRMADAKIVFVHGWRFRAPESVRRQADKIREYFRPVAGFKDASRQVVERLRQVAEVIIGVHLRQGDYRTWKQGQYFFPPERYAAWMRELAGQFPGRKTAFFICGDEPRQASEFTGLTVVIGAGPPVVDLYALAGCDYVLGPPSTFSQWASFYGNKPLYHLRSGDDRVERDRFSVSDLEEIP
jgi:hypothetical protein